MTRPPARLRGVEAAPNPAAVKVHLVLPRSFNDAQQIADRFKDGVPVILNLQSADQDLSKRLIDFASGLTYALDGGMQRVADKVFLLTPRNVEVSAEERAQHARARRLLQPGVGKPRPEAEQGAHGRHSPRSSLLFDAGSHGVCRASWTSSSSSTSCCIFALHPHVWIRLPYSPLAEPDPAVPLRRLRPVPAPLPALPAAARAARPLADGRGHLAADPPAAS